MLNPYLAKYEYKDSATKDKKRTLTEFQCAFF